MCTICWKNNKSDLFCYPRDQKSYVVSRTLQIKGRQNKPHQCLKIPKKDFSFAMVKDKQPLSWQNFEAALKITSRFLCTTYKDYKKINL